jgi:hypothetical protein
VLVLEDFLYAKPRPWPEFLEEITKAVRAAEKQGFERFEIETHESGDYESEFSDARVYGLRPETDEEAAKRAARDERAKVKKAEKLRAKIKKLDEEREKAFWELGEL